jgi:pSer/pThr/pTyr-binding forkhead associated (FHA) protein
LLETGDIFSFSNFLIQVNIEIKSEEEDEKNVVISSLLTLEVLFGEEERRKISFDSKNKKMVRIGRLKNNDTDFSFPDDDVSRKQCILIFEDNNWYINDGDGESKSSNGTWFYPERYFPITDGMIIRMGITTFECNIIE